MGCPVTDNGVYPELSEGAGAVLVLVGCGISLVARSRRCLDQPHSRHPRVPVRKHQSMNHGPSSSTDVKRAGATGGAHREAACAPRPILKNPLRSLKSNVQPLARLFSLSARARAPASLARGSQAKMAPLHAAAPLPPSASPAAIASCSSSSAPPLFVARPRRHRRSAAAVSCSLTVTTTGPWRKGFSSCPDHSPTASPPRTGRRSPARASSSSPALVSSVEDLYEFICSGPLVDRIGYTKEKIAESIDRWLVSGGHVARLFRLNELQLTEAEKTRIYHFYIPVFLWCEDQIIEHRAKYNEGDDIPPLVIGVSAPQGSGKTTLVFALDFLFRIAGRNSATLSIDDFYLTAKEQNQLRDNNPGNALLEFRGNAGSHDLQLSVDTLESLIKLTNKDTKMKVPRYDKSAFGGRGDRADPSTWPEVEGPLEVVLFEGWMLGFKPLPNEVVKGVDPQLEVVNKNLQAYYDAWDRFINSWMVIKIREPNCVYQWRLQAEIAMRADGKPGMSDEEVMDFVSRYLPAYHAYLPTLYKEGPNGSDPDHLLLIDIDDERNPLWGS